MDELTNAPSGVLKHGNGDTERPMLKMAEQNSLDRFVRRNSIPVIPGTRNFSETRIDRDLVSGVEPIEPHGERLGLVRSIHLSGTSCAHHGSINDATFSPSERMICSAGSDNKLKIWDPVDGVLVRTLHGHTSDALGVNFSSDELYLVSCGADRIIIIWDLTTYEISKTLRGHVDTIYRASISSDCNFIVSCGHDATIKTWFLTP